jgi:hypothetical protein
MSPTLRWPLYVLPVATVLVVTLALVGAGASRPYRVARLWGGPTEGERQSVRAEVLDVVEDRGAVHEAPAPGGSVTLSLHAPGFDAVRSAPLDSEGGAELSFDVPKGARPLELSASQEGKELARGRLALERKPWVRVARRRGGWVEAPVGDLTVRVAPLRGALAVPFEESLLVEVTQASAAASNLELRANATGARVTPGSAMTDARGRALFRIAPEEHVVTFTLDVGTPISAQRASFALAVVPGALRARRDGTELVIESPVPRDVAYFALVTEKERLLGGRAVLQANARGEKTARVPLPELPPEPVYAVVSSERDLRSPASVGWPLSVSANGEPERTFDAVEALLLDGRPRAMLREAQRRSRVRWVVAAFSAAALTIELLLLVAFTKRSDRSLDAHLEGAGMDAEAALRLAPKRSPAVIVALIAVALGFLVVALTGVLRME